MSKQNKTKIKSFLEGYFSSFTINQEPSKPIPQARDNKIKADINGLREDWKAVGKDFTYAVNSYGQSTKSRSAKKKRG